MKKTRMWIVTGWGQVKTQLRTVSDWERQRIVQYGNLWDFAFPTEKGAQDRALNNAEAMIAKLTGYRDAALKRLEELG